MGRLLGRQGTRLVGIAAVVMPCAAMISWELIGDG